MPAPRLLAIVALAVVALVALVAVLGGGSGVSKVPIRVVGDPAPRVAVKPQPTPRRRKFQHHRKPGFKRQPKGQLEEGKHEPAKASAQPHEQAAPEPEPAPIEEPEPEAAPVEAVEPEPPAAPAPTPPAVEFGM